MWSTRQNSPQPSESVFDLHFIAEYDDSGGTPVYYDPSYGVIYWDTNDFEDTAVAGYALQGTISGKYIWAVEPSQGLNQINFKAIYPQRSDYEGHGASIDVGA
jgi:hypothetical protein